MSIESFNLLLLVMGLMALVVFIALYFVRAGYGMFRSRSWGISVNNKIAWILMEAPVFLVMGWLWWHSDRRFLPVELTFFLFFSTSGLKNGWDGNAAFQSLQLAKLVWVAATSNRGGSHAFILDGFAYWRPQTRYLVKNFDFYFHTNMGWGGYYDGFYLVNKDLSITFDTSNGSYDRNFSMIYNIINK